MLSFATYRMLFTASKAATIWNAAHNWLAAYIPLSNLPRAIFSMTGSQYRQVLNMCKCSLRARILNAESRGSVPRRKEKHRGGGHQTEIP